MDRRRAAGALLALAACIASSAAAPTASNQTALDLYNETTEGCYYNFQHYGEGDRIMTNEPCLNCTCHNRMLMCYLRVCPFTKAIGQDCTVEKRADQCCPIVTCPDVPVDLLTSTSTSSPAEFGGTGVGKVDKYGCTINDKYFSEGAKVPPTPGKPCEHCYCIRNMTTCVMQECTLHVDGCTPIYHKDVCCPVRYYCDHPEDEMPLLDDMTTTVRPTPGFLLTTVASTEPPTTTLPARRDCIEDDQLYTDGALIKTDKPCEHCYCMKGDIVCVVQECGTPMENEGKNCTSLPPREGQCCPDTYICEGDELNTEVPITETLSEEPVTTIVPPRRASVEGSGYRNEPDEMSYTEVPTFATEMEGSGEEELTVQPEKDLVDKYGTTDEAEFIPLTTQVPISEKTEIVTTEPDKGLNTVPSGIVEEESTESALQEKTTSEIPLADYEHTRQDEQSTTPLAAENEKSSEPSLEITTLLYEAKATEPSIVEETTEKENVRPLEKETTLDENKQTESSVSREPETYITVKPEDNILSTKEPTITETATGTDLLTESVPGGDEIRETSDASVTPTSLSDEIKTTASPLVKEKDGILPSDNERITTVSLFTEEQEDERKTTVSTSLEEGEMLPSVDETKSTVLPLVEDSETFALDSRRTTLDLSIGITPTYEDKTEALVSEYTTSVDKLDTTEAAIIEQNTVSIGAEAGQSTEAPSKMTSHEESKITELTSTTERENIPTKPLEKEISEPSFEITTTTSRSIIDSSEILSTTVISQGKEPDITTEPIFKSDEEITSTESDMNKELSTIGIIEVAKETEEPSIKDISTEKATIIEQETEIKTTTLMVPEKQKEQEATTEFIMELSTLAHVTEKDLASTLHPENLATTTATVPDKIDMPQSTTINPAENEIAEIPSPGRIPGEGDCLLEEKTYQNDSVVPSTNKCHSGCKCVSSIIKCDPIICSSPPKNMDNCQPRYDTPEACCPTYVCDHGMQTIPPQSQSHITGTESPTTSTIECHGKDCDRHDEKPSDKPSQIPGQIDNDCGSSSCDQTIQSPAQPCTEDQCGVLKPPKEQEKPQEIPSIDTSQSCNNPEDCKEIKIPVTCEGQSCADSQGSPCDKEGGCLIKPEEMPVQETPQVCTTEEECKQIKIPQPESVPCEGESCVNAQEDCSTGECKMIDILPQPSQQGEKCSKENGCTKPDQAVECADAKCVQKEVNTTEIVCSGDICMQQQPTSSTEETAHTGSIATVSPLSEQVTSRQPILEEKTEPSSPKLPTTLPEEEITDKPTVTSEPNKETKEPEPPVSDEEDGVTKSPDEIVSSLIPETTDVEQALTESSNEPATEIPQEYSTMAIKIGETAIPVSSPTEEFSQHELEVKPTIETTKRPEDMTESHDVSTEKPEEFIEKETEVPKEQYNDTKHTDQSVSPPLDESTKKSEITDREQEPITVSPETFVTEAVKETIKPQQEPEKSSTGSQTPEMVTVSLSEETTKLSETSESGITVTETAVQESHEYPELSTSSGEIVTKMELTTKSPASMAAESTTSTYEKEHISTIHITEEQEDITKVPKEDTEKRTTTPEYSKDGDKTTTIVSDTTEAVVLADTKLPETDKKYITTEIPMKPTEFDEYVPTEHVSIEEIPEKHLISTETPEQSETATPMPNVNTDQTDIVDIDVKEKVTSMPETTIFDKETESPLTHVTELSHPDSTSIITESNEMPKSSSTAPSQEKEYDTTKTTLAPESDVMDEAAIPSGTKQTETPQVETTEEKLPVESATEQEVITEMPLSAVTESAKPFIIEQQPSLQPPTTDSEVPLSQEPVTRATVEEIPEVLEKTTSLPPELATIGEKVEEVTEPREPTIFEEHDISTDAPESPEKEVPDSATTNLDQEILTKEPELYVTVATHIDKPTESLEKEQKTEKPTLDVKKEQTVTSDTTENIPVIVTESQDLPEQVQEKVSTQIPVSGEEKTEAPEEFITKQTFTESPKTTVETEIMHHEPTIIPQLIDSEPQKSSTEKSIDTDLSTIIPELESTEQHDIEKESMPVTSSPEKPMEEAQTKLPEVQQTTSNAQPESASPEITKTTTISPKIEEIEHENKQTEQPVPLVTEQVLYTTAEPKDDTAAGQEDIVNKKEEKPAESTSEKISEITDLPVKISTMIPVSEEDKQPEEPVQTSSPEIEHSETTPYLVELEEHTHKIDYEEFTIIPSDEPTVASSEEPSNISSESSISTSEDSTNAPSLGTTIISSEEPAFAPSEKPTVIPSEQSTVAPTEEITLVPSKDPTVVQSEESTVATIAESTVSLLGEPTVSDSEEQSVASSEKPNVALSEELSTVISEEPTTTKSEMHTTEQQVIETVTEKLASEENQTELPVDETERPSDHKELVPLDIEEPHTTVTLEETPEKSTESIVAVETTSEIVKPTDELLDKYGSPEDSEKEATPTTLKPVVEDAVTMNIPFSETEKPASVGETEKVVTTKPQFVPAETTAPEEEFIPVTTKVTTSKPEEEAPTEISHSKPEDKPSEPASSATPEISKPDEIQPIDEVPLPEDESHFPPSGGYNQEPDYVEEDQAFGPGTCRYGGKVYVSAQQIPRDDPCDFCFCFRSDIICLQQSCPPPIHGCHEEPIQGFCCPRYECPVSMATTLNVTTTTTTTTTTLPPHFLPHAYKGAATRKGCQIKGHTYQVGEVVRASSGPCLHCTCGGDGQMKCDPKQCTPEPMLRQMIAAAVSAKRRR